MQGLTKSDKEVDKQNNFFIYNCFSFTIVFCFASIKSLRLLYKFIYRPTMLRPICELARPRVNIIDQFHLLNIIPSNFCICRRGMKLDHEDIR